MAADKDIPAHKPHMIGYARVSMSDQDNARQRAELVRYGVDPADIYEDKASGRSMKRKGWRACWKDLRAGDVLVVHSIDRLGRDVEEVNAVVRQMHERGANLVVLSQQDLDTRTPIGRLIFNVMLALAQWERESIVERTKHGLKIARERGRIGGQKPKVPDAKVIAAVRKIDRGTPGEEAAAEIGLSRTALYKRRARLVKEGKI